MRPARAGGRRTCGSRACRGSRPRPGRARSRLDRRFVAERRRRAAIGRVAPGSATWARVRKPPGVSSTAPNRASASGIRSAGGRRGESPAASGASGPPSARATKRATARRYSGELVQPRVLAARDQDGLDRRPGPPAGSDRRARPARPLRSRAMWAGGTTASSLAVGEQDRAAVAGDRVGGADLAHDVAARPEVDARRQPGERVGDRVGDRQVGEPERLAGQSVRVGRRRGRDEHGDARVGGRGQDRPDPAHRVPDDAAGRHLRSGEQGVEGGQRVERRTRRR